MIGMKRKIMNEKENKWMNGMKKKINEWKGCKEITGRINGMQKIPFPLDKEFRKCFE